MLVIPDFEIRKIKQCLYSGKLVDKRVSLPGVPEEGSIILYPLYEPDCQFF